ncbi:NUDIX domain-containing protein [Actinoplanes sp. GCM10030250]|uniref:NUDIX domain-containing protein n=1 Tax=Actinoplanes sp. GCM10030250 TaxID=3273376 RepID=UPI00360FD958
MTDDYTATLPRKRMAAAVLFFDDTGRLLLVEPAYTKTYWELPGGCVEADESPRTAAVREIQEELGLTVEPGRLLAIDWVPPRPGRTEGLMIVFDGGRLSPQQVAAIHLPPGELRSWAWSNPHEQEQRLSPLLARRAAASLEARTKGETAYLEDGYSAS